METIGYNFDNFKRRGQNPGDSRILVISLIEFSMYYLILHDTKQRLIGVSNTRTYS